MMHTEVGIRELKTRLSTYMHEVEAGKTVVITKHGKPVGRIVPETRSIEARLETLNQAELVVWSGEKLPKIAPVAKAKGSKTVANLLLEERR